MADFLERFEQLLEKEVSCRKYFISVEFWMYLREKNPFHKSDFLFYFTFMWMLFFGEIINKTHLIIYEYANYIIILLLFIIAV